MVTSATARRQEQAGWQREADDPVLTSKITAPGVPSWTVQRPRISKLIAQGAQNPLTVITGGPGAGKTMALTLWAAAHPAALAWVTLDDYDNQPRVFWSYVVAALHRAGIAVPRAWPAAARGQAVNHAFLVKFAAAMAVQDPPVTLVLDDFHLLTEPRVLDGLEYVLRNAGRGLHLVVASRMDPLLPLHRYRLGGQLTEIRTGDLIFSSPEARLLVAQHGVELSAESLDSLIRRAEGWAAGLRLAAISMAGHPDPGQFVKEFAAEDSAVTGYLVQEVLDAQPARVRDFLLRTSILDRVSADIAAELTGGGPDPNMLPALARANTFIRPAGQGRYRYHSLFAAVLCLKLRREQPDLFRELHLRAASWFRRSGSLAEAVRHAGSVDDWRLAASIVLDELAVGRLIEPRGSERLADGFRRMPHDPESADPQLLLVDAAIELSRGQYDMSRASLGAAESILDRLAADAEIPSRLGAAMIRIALSRRTGNVDARAVAAGRTMLDAVSEDVLARHPEVQAQVLCGRGAAEFWSGRADAAANAFDAGAAAASTPEGAHERADCLGHLALLEALRGRLDHAAELAADVACAPEHGAAGPAEPVSSAAEVALACVHTERNELSLARARLKRADEMLRARPDRLISAAACLVAARRRLAEGRPGATLEIVGQLRRGWSPPSWLDRRLRLLESSACAAMPDVDSAVAAAASAGSDRCLDAAAALAHAWLAAGDLQAASRALASVPAGTETPDPARLEGLLADARLGYASVDTGRGHRSLEQALRLAEQERLRLPFALHRRWIRPVLRREPELAATYRHLLEPDLVEPAAVQSAQPCAGPQPPLIVERLSEREREVLRHVAAMLSTAEIAAEMYISVNTVKTHLKSIYRKLAATHRGEAVRRARELKLL